MNDCHTVPTGPSVYPALYLQVELWKCSIPPVPSMVRDHLYWQDQAMLLLAKTQSQSIVWCIPPHMWEKMFHIFHLILSFAERVQFNLPLMSLVVFKLWKYTNESECEYVRAESALLGQSETQAHFMSKTRDGMKRMQTHIQLGTERVSFWCQ